VTAGQDGPRPGRAASRTPRRCSLRHAPAGVDASPRARARLSATRGIPSPSDEGARTEALAGRRQTPRRPHIYGEESKARRDLARYIAQGQELLDQAVGVRKRVAEAQARVTARAKAEAKKKPRRAKPSPGGFLLTARLLTPEEVGQRVARDWSGQVESWEERAERAMQRLLQEQSGAVLPAFTDGPAGNYGIRYSLDNAEPWLEQAVAELRALQDTLGVRRNIEPTPPAATSFAELHGSGLVDAKVITDAAKRMTGPRTPTQCGHAIGAAKELTEATLRGALTRLGETPGKREDLPALMKKWRQAIAKLAPPDPAGQAALDAALASLANLVRFLAEWRNLYGTGHGRPKYPPGLKPRHARVATDAAETCIRFIVTTMDDEELLAP
jgi:abortive infection Abi-like protein